MQRYLVATGTKVGECARRHRAAFNLEVTLEGDDAVFERWIERHRGLTVDVGVEAHEWSVVGGASSLTFECSGEGSSLE